MGDLINNRKEFFKEYNISEDEFTQTGLDWSVLESIYKDFVDRHDELEETVLPIFQAVSKMPKVHSVRFRIKNPEHLIEKIIRNKIQNPQSTDITLDNYCEEILDLMGVRILHLYKSDWQTIHKCICKKWNLKKDRPPKAYYREGDEKSLIEKFKSHGCIPEKHKYGYRSVHYNIETTPQKKTYYVEIQVRTIFEEAWSEIDHNVRYPYDLENPILKQYLMIFNRLAGSADEMGSFVVFLAEYLKREENEHKKTIAERDAKINELESQVKALNNKDDSKAINKTIKELRGVSEKLDSSYDFKDFKLPPYFNSLNSIPIITFPYTEFTNKWADLFKPSENWTVAAQTIESICSSMKQIQDLTPKQSNDKPQSKKKKKTDEEE